LFQGILLLVLIAVTTMTTVVQPFLSSPAHAAASMEDIDKQIRSTLLRNALLVCAIQAPLSGGGGFDQNKRIDESAALKYEWFGGNGLNNVDIAAGIILKTKYEIGSISDSGMVPCQSGAFIKTALRELGFTNLDGLDNVVNVMCELGFRRSSSPSADTSIANCKTSTGDWRRGEVNGNSDSGETKVRLRDTIREKTAGGAKNLGNAAKYLIYANAVKSLCSPDAGQVGQSASLDSKVGGMLKEIRSGEAVEVTYTWGEGRKSFSTTVGVGEGYGQAGIVDWTAAGYTVFPMSTINIEGGLRNNTVILSQPYWYGGWGMGTDNPCTQLATYANTFFGDYKAFYDLLDEDEQEVANQDNDIAGASEDEGQTTCAVEGVGWIICPVVNFLAGLADGIYGMVEHFLVVDAKTLDPGAAGGNGAYSAWQIMRTFANIVLVIAFLVIIYSQLTQQGISNYGIKKLLPRLLLTAVAINVSYIIVQLGVDISNVLGMSLKRVLSDLPVFTGPDGNWVENTLSQGNFFTDIAAGILIGNVALGAFAVGAVLVYFVGLAVFIPVVLGAVIAVGITFFILLARQMLIVLLAVVAPLAFAAMLLPNTQEWFKKWRKMLVGLLLVYPAISLLFGASQLAANVLIQVDPGNTIWTISAAAVAVLPLFFTPALLKGSLNAIPALGNMAAKLQGKAVSGGRSLAGKGTKWAGERTATGNGKFSRFASRSLHGRGMAGRRRQAAAKKAYEQPRMDDLMRQWEQVDPNTGTALAFDTEALSGIAMSKPDTFEGQAALSMLASQQEAVALGEVRSKFAEENNPAKLAAYNRAIAPHYGALKAKDPRAVQDMDAGEWAKVKQSDMHSIKDKALQAGAAASPAFAQSLREAVNDPEQSRYFSAQTRKDFGAAAATSGGGPGAPAPSTTETSSASARAAASSGLISPINFDSTGFRTADGSKVAASANAVETQISARGGMDNLSDEEVLKVVHHADETLGHVNDDATNQLGSDAIDEAKRRGLK